MQSLFCKSRNEYAANDKHKKKERTARRAAPPLKKRKPGGKTPGADVPDLFPSSHQEFAEFILCFLEFGLFRIFQLILPVEFVIGFGQTLVEAGAQFV